MEYQQPDPPDLYDALFERSLDAILLTEPSGGVLRANAAACRILRCTEEEIRRFGRARFAVADAALERLIEERRRTGIAKGIVTFRRLDGSTFDVEVASTIARSRDGAALTYVFFRELPAAGQAERELAESERRLRGTEARYRDLVEMSPDAVLVNRGGRVDFVNAAALALFGATAPSQLLGRPALALFAPECHDRVRARIGLLAKGERVPPVEEIIVRLDGTRREVEVTAAPFVDGGGEAFQVLLRDATDRKAAGRALLERERRFRQLVEDSADLTFVLDAEGRFTFSTPASARVLGQEPEALVGRSFFDFTPVEDRAEGPERLARMQTASGAVGRRRYELRGPEGWRTFDLTARNQLDDPALRGIVINGREVTQELLLQEQIRQAQKLESVGRLAGGVAHDFNNLLTVILSCAEELRTALAAGRPAALSDVEEIAAAGVRAAELTRRLLTFARKQVITPRNLDLHEVIRGSRSLLQRLLGEDVVVALSLQAARATVRCDPVQLEQVLLNLAVNARDAMPRGGSLFLETRDAPAGEPAPDRPEALGDGHYVRLTVRDTGHGMPAEVREHLFEPFFTTKPKGSGTGLGLATVYGIVKQNGGWISVDSAPGRGTAFDLWLPAVPGAPDANDAPDDEGPRGTESILLVEDDPGVREVTARALRSGGYRVRTVENGAAALAALADDDFAPDLLITDVVMPEMDGRALADALRRGRPGLGVLFVSGYSHEALGRPGELAAGIELLAKPFTADALRARVRRVLDARPAAFHPR